MKIIKSITKEISGFMNLMSSEFKVRINKCFFVTGKIKSLSKIFLGLGVLKISGESELSLDEFFPYLKKNRLELIEKTANYHLPGITIKQ